MSEFDDNLDNLGGVGSRNVDIEEILDSLFPDVYINTGTAQDAKQFSKDKFFDDYGMYFEKYDVFDEDMITKTSDLVKSDMLRDNLGGVGKIANEFSSANLMGGDYEKNLSNYLKTVGNALTTANVNELTNIYGKRKDFREDTLDKFLEFVRLGALEEHRNAPEFSLGDFIEGNLEDFGEDIAIDIGDGLSDPTPGGIGSQDFGDALANTCCFIILETEEKTGLNKDVRKYRDEQLNETNKAGYYKLAQVVVPMMRKYKLIKWFFKYGFASPAKYWAKWYYHKKGIGWIFEPLRRFWLGLFMYLGKNHKMKEDSNG